MEWRNQNNINYCLIVNFGNICEFCWFGDPLSFAIRRYLLMSMSFIVILNSVELCAQAIIEKKW